MHTDEMLKLLDQITVCLGGYPCSFQLKTCAAFNTRELKWEVEHRQHCELKTPGRRSSATATASTSQVTRRPKTFNLQTYKVHALGDYLSSIRKFGTTDSYSTEPVIKCTRYILHYCWYGKQGELEHHISKARYCQTDGKEFMKQMASIECCEARIHHIQDLNDPPLLGTNVEERVATTPDAHFHIGKSQNFPENIPMFLCKHPDNPAIIVCWPSL